MLTVRVYRASLLVESLGDTVSCTLERLANDLTPRSCLEHGRQWKPVGDRTTGRFMTLCTNRKVADQDGVLWIERMGATTTEKREIFTG